MIRKKKHWYGYKHSRFARAYTILGLRDGSIRLWGRKDVLITGHLGRRLGSKYTGVYASIHH
jgi:hypothetical protein